MPKAMWRKITGDGLSQPSGCDCDCGPRRPELRGREEFGALDRGHGTRADRRASTLPGEVRALIEAAREQTGTRGRLGPGRSLLEHRHPYPAGHPPGEAG